ncbi:hypothetical protein BJ878DRAFT_111026 [Calycina marina]|uniref:Uncharacterized protein n=1 Tax=Calycina marina TaxID=1763456 RepID=A0A9P8CE05_9HELO|nr:hypothetical protein BJ878DRAFT_111026 [Calycina marina]
MSMRHALIPEAEEKAAFPIKRLVPNTKRIPDFYGRQDELEMIEKHLAPSRERDTLRSSTIYRRGVGKTKTPAHFAHTSGCCFDAIFWVQCETSVGIRESFTDTVVSLEIPRASREVRHEENLLAVQNWLKRAGKTWLLIFDNAGSSSGNFIPKETKGAV